MSITALLTDLEAAGIHLFAVGGLQRVQQLGSAASAGDLSVPTHPRFAADSGRQPTLTGVEAEPILGACQQHIACPGSTPRLRTAFCASCGPTAIKRSLVAGRWRCVKELHDLREQRRVRRQQERVELARAMNRSPRPPY